MMTKAD
jgi:dynein heavy chain